MKTLAIALLVAISLFNTQGFAEETQINIPKVNTELLFLRIDSADFFSANAGDAYLLSYQGVEIARLRCNTNVRGNDSELRTSEGLFSSSSYSISSEASCREIGAAIQNSTTSGRAVKITVNRKMLTLESVDYL